MTSLEMRRRAGEVRARAEAIWRAHDGTEDEHTAEELAEYDRLCGEHDALIQRANAYDEREARFNALDRQGQSVDANSRESREVGAMLSRYSLLRVIESLFSHRALGGVEAEISQELSTRFKRSPQGVFIPWDLPSSRSAPGPHRRDLTTITGAGAVAEVTSSTFIESLRARSLASTLGVRVLSDMQGNFSIPKQTGTTTASWVTQGNAPGATNATFGSVDFSPSTLAARTVISRAFVKQTSIDAEMFARDEIATTIAKEVDRVCFNGSGVGAEPEGIIPNTSVNTVALGADGAAPTWTAVVQMEEEVDVDNALLGSLAYVVTAKGRGKLKRTTKVANAQVGDFLWDDGNYVNGYPAWSSNQLPSNLTKGNGTNLSAMIFGDWSQGIHAFWGPTDLTVDPYTGGSAGNINLYALLDADFQLRHAVAFSVIKDMLTT